MSYIPLIRSKRPTPILADNKSATAVDNSIRSCHSPPRDTKFCYRIGEDIVQDIAASNGRSGSVEAIRAARYAESVGGKSRSDNGTIISVSARVIGVAIERIMQFQTLSR